MLLPEHLPDVGTSLIDHHHVTFGPSNLGLQLLDTGAPSTGRARDLEVTIARLVLALLGVAVTLSQMIRTLLWTSGFCFRYFRMSEITSHAFSMCFGSTKITLAGQHRTSSIVPQRNHAQCPSALPVPPRFCISYMSVQQARTYPGLHPWRTAP